MTIVLVNPRGFEREVIRRRGEDIRVVLTNGTTYQKEIKDEHLAQEVMVLDVTETSWNQARLVL